jgi:hypothetical protein
MATRLAVSARIRRSPASRLAAVTSASHRAGARSNHTRRPEPGQSGPPSIPAAWRLSPPSCGTCHRPHPGHTTARGSPGNNLTWPGGSSLARSGGLPSRSRGMTTSRHAPPAFPAPAGTHVTAEDRQRHALHKGALIAAGQARRSGTSGHDGRSPRAHISSWQGASGRASSCDDQPLICLGKSIVSEAALDVNMLGQIMEGRAALGRSGRALPGDRR